VVNIRTDLREIEWEGVDWMYLAQDSDQWRVDVNTNELSGTIKCGDC